jgi:hypothetical protein
MTRPGLAEEERGAQEQTPARHEEAAGPGALTGLMARVLERQAEILGHLSRPRPAEAPPPEQPKPKDAWDRAGIIATFFSAVAGVLLGIAGLYFADVYRDSEAAARAAEQVQSRRMQDMQVLAQYIPLLASDNEVQQRLAIRAIYVSGSAELVQAVATKNPTPAVAEELRDLLRSPVLPQEDRTILLKTYNGVLQLLPVTRDDPALVRRQPR